MRNGVEAIAHERYRQIDEEGYTLQKDLNEDRWSFVLAAEAYINSAEGFAYPQGKWSWPWDKKYFKPKSLKRDLVRAGAFIAAALDRLNYEYFADGPKVVYHRIAGKAFVQAYLIEWRGYYPNRVWVSDIFKTRYEAITELYLRLDKEYSDKEITDLFRERFRVVMNEYLRQKKLNHGIEIPEDNKGLMAKDTELKLKLWRQKH